MVVVKAKFKVKERLLTCTFWHEDGTTTLRTVGSHEVLNLLIEMTASIVHFPPGALHVISELKGFFLLLPILFVRVPVGAFCFDAILDVAVPQANVLVKVRLVHSQASTLMCAQE
jgi:hypothetical protein